MLGLRTVDFGCVFSYCRLLLPDLVCIRIRLLLEIGSAFFPSAPRAEVMKMGRCIFGPFCLNALDLHTESIEMMAFDSYKGVSKAYQILCSSTYYYTTLQQDPVFRIVLNYIFL
jgi:hypothetical protein